LASEVTDTSHQPVPNALGAVTVTVDPGQTVTCDGLPPYALVNISRTTAEELFVIARLSWPSAPARYPDLSGNEQATADRIRTALRDVDCQPVAGTGLLARIGRRDGPSIAVRAELDALPVFAASPGAINAAVCDFHITITGSGDMDP